MTAEQQTLVTDNLGLALYLAKGKRIAGYDREDRNQVAFLGLVQAAKSYDPSKGKFSSVAWECVKNELIRQSMYESRPKRHCDAAPYDDDISLTDRSGWDLFRALGLKPADYDLLLDRFVRDKTLREIGLEHGVANTSVRMREKRILRRCRKIIRGWMQNCPGLQPFDLVP